MDFQASSFDATLSPNVKTYDLLKAIQEKKLVVE